MTRYLDLGCTRLVHARLGVDAVVNARGGLSHLNQPTQEDIELRRDSHAIHDRLTSRVRLYQLGSRFFRRARNRNRVSHLMSSYSED